MPCNVVVAFRPSVCSVNLNAIYRYHPRLGNKIIIVVGNASDQPQAAALRYRLIACINLVFLEGYFYSPNIA